MKIELSTDEKAIITTIVTGWDYDIPIPMTPVLTRWYKDDPEAVVSILETATGDEGAEKQFDLMLRKLLHERGIIQDPNTYDDFVKDHNEFYENLKQTAWIDWRGWFEDAGYDRQYSFYNGSGKYTRRKGSTPAIEEQVQELIAAHPKYSAFNEAYNVMLYTVELLEIINDRDLDPDLAEDLRATALHMIVSNW